MRRPPPTVEEIWRAYDAVEERLTAPVSERMLALAGLEPGCRVLDLATGRGEPAVRAARRVAPGGAVVGIDIAESMLRMARERAEREGVVNLELKVGNAETLDGLTDRRFDAALSRWGLMYLEAPVAALAATRAVLVPGAKLVLAVWAEPERVDFFSLPRRVLAQYAPVPAIDFEAPGTFRYADQRRFERDLATAGFTIESVEEQEVEVMEAASAAELIAWTRAFGMTRLLNELPEDIQTAWEKDLVKECRPLGRNGLVRLGGTTRIVVARPTASTGDEKAHS